MKKIVAVFISGLFIIGTFASVAIAHDRKDVREDVKERAGMEKESRGKTDTIRMVKMERAEKVFNVEEAKSRALAKIEKVEKQLQTVLAKIQSNTEAKIELRQKIVNNAKKVEKKERMNAMKEKMASGIEKKLEKLAELKTQIQKATTREELKKMSYDVHKGMHERAKKFIHKVKETHKNHLDKLQHQEHWECNDEERSSDVESVKENE